ncbi:CsbD family protein [Parvularcula mediterranea]|nr:CsbD family protein [Parvularcula mediterranea]
MDGQSDQIKGSIKEAVGEATGDRSLERQGEREQSQGALKKAWGNIKDAFSGSKH